MISWDPWRGCRKCSEGCRHCYIHKGDYKRGIDTSNIEKTKQYNKPVVKKKDGSYKIAGQQLVNLGFKTDFLIEEADFWRYECYRMMQERFDLSFQFLTKRIERFSIGLPKDWGSGIENLSVGCSVENQKAVDHRIPLLIAAPIKHRMIICQPLIEAVNLEAYLDYVDLVVVGGESDWQARPLRYEWVLSIRDQCIKHRVAFQFRQCGTYFVKDNVRYKIPIRQQMSQARKANLDYDPQAE